MKKYFEFIDPSVNAAKFWCIEIIQKKIEISYGRIGIEHPAKIVKVFDSVDDAQKYEATVIKEKTKKGYIKCNPKKIIKNNLLK